MTSKSNPDVSDAREKIGDRVTIYRRGKRWYANYQDSQKQRRVSLKTTSKKTARHRALRIELAIADGTYKSSKKAPKIKTVTDAYLQHLRTERRATKTIQKVKLVVRRVLDLADRRRAQSAVEIDLAFVDAYRAERVAANAMPKTLLNETVIIRQIVNFALSRKLMREDSLAGLTLRKVKSPEQPCWTRHEVEQILSMSTGRHRDALIVMAETGMRVGEAKWLTWDDVDRDYASIRIRPKDQWVPKTGDQRVVPTSPILRKLLIGLPRRSRWVLTAPPSRRYPEGTAQISERRLLLHLKGLLKRLGLKGHLHTFRHAFISNALISNTAEAMVRNWVGHVDAEIMRHYTHISDTASQEAMAKLAASGRPAAKKTSGRCSTSSPRRPGRGSAQAQHT